MLSAEGENNVYNYILQVLRSRITTYGISDPYNRQDSPASRQLRRFPWEETSRQSGGFSRSAEHREQQQEEERAASGYYSNNPGTGKS